MGLWSAIKGVTGGEGWNRSFGYLYLSEAEIARGRALDNQLDAINRKTFEAGKWSEDQYRDVLARTSGSTLEAELDNPDTSIWGGFKQGWKEGEDNVKKTIKDAVAWPIDFALGSIPMQVWVILALVVLWKLGWLGKWLRAK